MAKIRIRQCAGAVEAGRGTILEAALRAGLPYPHSCRSGACGACKTRLHEGEVTMGPHDPAALTATERRRGLILACRARPRGDVEVEWLGGAAAPVLRLRGRVHSLESPNPEVRILRVETDSRLPSPPASTQGCASGGCRRGPTAWPTGPTSRCWNSTSALCPTAW
ncbi:MAG: 2Fe-2S iron-sulfur cluster binding domain-containing protein [Rhodospirillales bacterium]|nr:2Fe-2S iron-sulfur cluster binding domain-containing protein [Rhodospirillales bacterium]